jgi:hypothetical protein
MAVLPTGAEELDFEEALRHHKSWTQHDRDRVRAVLLEEHPEVDESDEFFPFLGIRWYVPPSGGYVAGHVGKSSSTRAEMNRTFGGSRNLTDLGIPAPTNKVYLHAGHIVIHADTADPVTIELSGHRPTGSPTRGPSCVRQSGVRIPVSVSR